MISVEIPGVESLRIEHYVTDFSGTLAEDGCLAAGMRDRLGLLAGMVKVHILTSDTFGRALAELDGIDCAVKVLEGEGHVFQKQEYVLDLGCDGVFAVGNGRNDVKMLEASRVAVAVCLAEGCAGELLRAADVTVRAAVDAPDLLLHPKRLVATLRI